MSSQSGTKVLVHTGVVSTHAMVIGVESRGVSLTFKLQPKSERCYVDVPDSTPTTTPSGLKINRGVGPTVVQSSWQRA